MKNDEKLSKHGKKLKNVAGIGIATDTIINSAFLYGSLTVNENGLIALIACIVFAIFWFNSVFWAASFGIEILANAEEEKKQNTMPLWLGFMAVVLVISVYMTTSFLGLDLAKKEYQQESIARVLEVETNVSKQHATAMGLESILESSSGSAKLMKKMEINNGSISGRSGVGIVASELASLEDISITVKKQLRQASGLAEPIKRDISELKEDIRRISTNEDLDYDEKANLLKEKIELLSLAIKQLQQNIPMNSITNAIDAMGRDFKSAGINDQASQRITATFSPFNKRLAQGLGEIRDATRIEIPSIRNLNDFDLLSQSQSVLPILAIAFILASMPLGLTFCMFLISPTNVSSQKRSDGESGGKDHETADSISSLHMKSNSTKH